MPGLPPVRRLAAHRRAQADILRVELDVSMRSQQHHLAFYGEDSTLLDTRRLLLNREGYDVDTVVTERSFADIMRSAARYSLVILCYTLPDARATAHAIAGRAGVPVWQLESLMGPPKFLAAVSKALG